MINSKICTNCICVPMCKNKLNHMLMADCAYLVHVINKACNSLDKYEVVFISFESLNREFLIERTETQWLIKDTKFNYFDIEDGKLL